MIKLFQGAALLLLLSSSACAGTSAEERTDESSTVDEREDERDDERDEESDRDARIVESASRDAGGVRRDGSTATEAPPLPRDAGERASRDAASETERDGGIDASASIPDSRDAGKGPDGGSSRDASVPSGDGGVLSATLVVRAGETFDGKNRRYSAGPALGDGSQAEGQKPLFKLEPGAKLINVVLGAPAADGIHTYGDATLENIVWEDIGEDALTIKESGTVILRGGSAQDGDDKIFQINAASTFRVSDFKAARAGKFIRQNGGTTFKVEVFIDRCDISSMKEAIFRTDSKTSTVTMTNSRHSAIGKELFIGVTPSNVVSTNNVAY